MSSRITHANQVPVYFAFANGRATSCARSMNSCASGLIVRFFRVTIPTGRRGPVAPPTLGQHTREVLGKVLDYSPERIDALVQEGAIRCGDEAA